MKDTVTAKQYLYDIGMRTPYRDEQECLEMLINSHKSLRTLNITLRNHFKYMPKWKKRIAKIFKFYPYIEGI